MRKMVVLSVLLSVFVLFSVFDIIASVSSTVEEGKDGVLSGNETKVEMHSMIATAYCLKGTTASGTQTRSGVAASKREWFGRTAKVYKNSNGNIGELIGVYTIEDTGGKPIQNGSVIDLWMPTRDECLQFGRKTVYVIIE